jgi:lysophospholipase L1-like esterase
MKNKITIALCIALYSVSLLAAPAPTLSNKYVFTDETAEVILNSSSAEVAYEMKTITRDGWVPSENGKVAVKNGKIQIKPLEEGIHILTLKTEPAVELRFLAIMPPPSPMDPDALRRALPRSAEKILKGEPCKILAMGDSVTNTGDFENMLAMMLSRASGNRNISVVDKSYPGRSIDASVRNFQDDAIFAKPDLALIMYGLNDQGSGASPDGYLEQYEWLAKHLAQDCGSDAVFLQPTPHIDIPVRTEDAPPGSNPPEYAFRTIGFAESVSQLAKKMKIPCAETFNAIWGDGGKTVGESAEKIWPLYPTSYSAQFSSLIESDGKGDTIHPNALGHLMIAKAVYNSLACPQIPALLEKKAVSIWTDSGVKSTISMANRSDKVMVGKLAVFPRMECGPLNLTSPGEYKINPGETSEFKVEWPDAIKPEDLFKYPAIACLAPGNPIIAVVIYSEGKTNISGVPAPFGIPSFIRERLVVEKPKVQVRLDNGERMEIELPPDKDNGRIPLILKVRNGWAVAELAFCRYAPALKGEVVVDGDDKEWSENKYSVVGEAFQARWVRGIEDKRTSPSECNLKWTCKAGGQGLFFCIRAEGSVEKDNFTFFFDIRKPELLGTPGPYYWVSGSLSNDGIIKVSKGETSKKAAGLAGKWKKTDNGAFMEIFIPYELMEIDSYPESGDIGFSLWWTHNGNAGITNLMWSEDGHPWNTRWYGIIRIEKEFGQNLPYMIRIK